MLGGFNIMVDILRRYDLMIPGPIAVDGEVLQQMASPVVAHYGPDWAALFNDTVGLAKQVFRTQNDLFIMPGSGHIGVEAALASLVAPGDEVIIVDNGLFGHRAVELAQSNGACVRPIEVEWGDTVRPCQVEQAIAAYPGARVVVMVQSETSTGLANPVKDVAAACREHDRIVMVDGVSSVGGMDIRIDEWGIDVCVTASQKCLEAPPGLALVSVSQKAFAHMRQREKPVMGWAMNLLKWKDCADQGRDVQPYYVTMPVNNVLALRKALERILAEGLEARHERHQAVGQAFRDGVRRLGLEPVGQDCQASGTVGVFWVPEGHADRDVVSSIRDNYGIQVAGGLGRLAGQTVRVGHMGTGARMARIVPVLYALERWLESTGLRPRD
jgi:alanine-glyoxylate transaminase/serine-glyoxylate transaminase/serine-pyruvate transaminase